MTSLIERLRSTAQVLAEDGYPIRATTVLDGADALWQARPMVVAWRDRMLSLGNIIAAERGTAWLRLIDGEQEKEG